MEVSKDIQEVYDNIVDYYENLSTKYTVINESNLDESLMKLSSNCAFVGSIVAYAKFVEDTLESDLETLEFTIRKQSIDELNGKGIRATKDAIDSMTYSNTELTDAKEAHVLAVYKYNLCKNLLISITHQKDMLIQISSNRRAEVKLHT